MFLSLSGIHLFFLSFIGSWLSWNNHFRWAIKHNSIRALWVLFKCKDYKELSINFFIYGLYYNSLHTGKNEVRPKCILLDYQCIGFGGIVLYLQLGSSKFLAKL